MELLCRMSVKRRYYTGSFRESGGTVEHIDETFHSLRTESINGSKVWSLSCSEPHEGNILAKRLSDLVGGVDLLGICVDQDFGEHLRMKAATASTPSSMKMAQSPTSWANPISCVATTMVMPSLARSFMTCSTSPTISGSSAEVGSSKRMSSGFIARPRVVVVPILRCSITLPLGRARCSGNRAKKAKNWHVNCWRK